MMSRLRAPSRTAGACGQFISKGATMKYALPQLGRLGLGRDVSRRRLRRKDPINETAARDRGSPRLATWLATLRSAARSSTPTITSGIGRTIVICSTSCSPISPTGTTSTPRYFSNAVQCAPPECDRLLGHSDAPYRAAGGMTPSRCTDDPPQERAGQQRHITKSLSYNCYNHITHLRPMTTPETDAVGEKRNIRMADGLSP
jgi:hypothetical protein